MPGGRPSKLTPEVQAKIIEGILSCLPQASAAKLAGISEKTFYNWVQRGKTETKGRYFEFVQALKTAEEQAQKNLVDNIKRDDYQKTRGWQRWAWILERRWPERWAQKKEDLNIKEEIVVDLVGHGD